MQDFYDLVYTRLADYKKINPHDSESQYVDRLVDVGNSKLVNIGQWEYEHQVLRKEQARETSFMKEDKTHEIIRIMERDTLKPLDQVDAELKKRGMSLSIIEKIYLLMAKRDRLMIDTEHLMAKRKE